MATLYLKIAGGNWNTANTWSNVNAGGVDNSGPPAAGDNCIAELLSGAVTINSGSVCRSFDTTSGASSYGGTITHTAAVTWTIGDATAGAGSVALKLNSGVTYAPSADTCAITFASTASATNQSVDFGGKSPGAVTFNTAGQWYLATGFTTRAATTIVTHTVGTLHYDGASDNSALTHSWGFWLNTNAGTRTTTLGTVTLNITGTGTVVNVVATSNTFSGASSTINMTGANPRMIAGTRTYGTVTFDNTGTADLDGGTFTTLTMTNTGGDATCAMSLRGGPTVTTTFTVTGNSASNRYYLRSQTLGTAQTITCTGATVTTPNTDVRDITFARTTAGDLDLTQGGTVLVGNAGGNTRTGGTGIVTFTTPASQTWQTVAGGSWGTAANWTSRVPLPQDDVTFAGVAFNSGVSITTGVTAQRLGENINIAGYTFSGTKPTFTFVSTAHTVFGSLTFSGTANMTLTQSQPMIFEGRGSFNLTSAGIAFLNDVTIQAVGGTYTLLDAFAQTAAADLSITIGGFNANNFNVTSRVISSSNTNVRSVLMGSGIWTSSASTATPWVFTTTTNLTFSAGTSTIYISSTALASTFAGGGLTYNDLEIAGGGTSNAVSITGANTFNRIYTDGAGVRPIILPGSTTTTIISGLGLANGTNVITFTSSAGSATVSKSGGGTVSWDYVNLTNIPAAQATTWYAGTHSTDGGGNTNWVFTDPPVGGNTSSLFLIF